MTHTNHIPIAGEKNLSRDMHSKAIMINDHGAFEDYKRRRMRANGESAALAEMRSEMDVIKSNISEMYELLKRLAS